MMPAVYLIKICILEHRPQSCFHEIVGPGMVYLCLPKSYCLADTIFFRRLLLFVIIIVQHVRYFTSSQDGIEYFCVVSGSINENGIPCYIEKKILITSCHRLFKR